MFSELRDLTEQIDVIQDRKNEYLQLKSDIEALKDIFTRVLIEMPGYKGPYEFLERKIEQVLYQLRQEVCCLLARTRSSVDFQIHLFNKYEIDTTELLMYKQDLESCDYDYHQTDASKSAVKGLATKYKSNIQGSLSYRLYNKYPNDEDVINLLRNELRTVIYSKRNRIDNDAEKFFCEHFKYDKYDDVDLLLKDADYIIAFKEEQYAG